jgi:D-glycero-D-manno-heptose 1,7-bisphosphate phosphatase
MRLGVLFERDGILNRVRVENHLPARPLRFQDFQINEAAIGPLGKLKAAGYVLLATTNQPALARGHQSRRELEQMHTLLMSRFPLDDVLLCPHDEADHCSCRKPKPGLLIEAAFKWHLDLDRSFVVGDRWQDAEAARVAGCTSLLLKSPWNGPGHHDFILDSLDEMAEKILRLSADNHLPSARLILDQNLRPSAQGI